MVSYQIEAMRQKLNTKWCDAIQSILNRGVKKKYLPDVTKQRIIRRFFDCVAALMTQNLQDIAMRSLMKYTDFMCNVGVSFFIA